MSQRWSLEGFVIHGQHGGRIALLTSEIAMGDDGEGHDGVTVLAWQFGLAQTFD